MIFSAKYCWWNWSQLLNFSRNHFCIYIYIEMFTDWSLGSSQSRQIPRDGWLFSPWVPVSHQTFSFTDPDLWQMLPKAGKWLNEHPKKYSHLQSYHFSSILSYIYDVLHKDGIQTCRQCSSSSDGVSAKTIIQLLYLLCAIYFFIK